MKSEGRPRIAEGWRFSARMNSRCCVVPRKHTHLKSVICASVTDESGLGSGQDCVFY